MADFTKHEIIEIIQDNVIDDITPSTDKVYSSTKSKSDIDTLQAEINAITPVGNSLFLYYNFS